MRPSLPRRLYRPCSPSVPLFATLLFVLTARVHAADTIHSFTSGYSDGASPVGQTVQSGSHLYGFTYFGVGGKGSVYRMTTSGAVTTLAELPTVSSGPENPNAGPILVGGVLYGTSFRGGNKGLGTVFRATLGSSSTITVLHHFGGYSSAAPASSDGANAAGGLFYGSDGFLYGTTLNGGVKDAGTVFRLRPDGTGYQILRSFDSATDSSFPYTAVCEGPDGRLYGSNRWSPTFKGGLYRINRDGTGYQHLHSFTDADTIGHSFPGDLVAGPDGRIYGACSQGGANGMGALFRIDPETGSVTPVWSFDGATGAFPNRPYYNNPQYRLTLGTDGLFYGSTALGGLYGFGTLFTLNPASGFVTRLTSLTPLTGGGYAGPLTRIGKILYGSSFYGGASAGQLPSSPDGFGASFSCSATGTLKLTHSWYIPGAYPVFDAPVRPVGGYLYGATPNGGLFNQGAIYKLQAGGSNAFSILHSFNDTLLQGKYPSGGLLRAADGAFYGCTSEGGLYGDGTLFKVTTGGVFTVLRHFRDLQEGGSPRRLTQGYGGDRSLYGTCASGGPNGNGTVFKVDTAGKSFQILRNFLTAGGARPSSSLTVEPDIAKNTTKALYGLARLGGANGFGTLYRITPNGDSYQVAHHFAHATGVYPIGHHAPLILTGGSLYGTAEQGGSRGDGVLFRFDIASNVYSVVHNFWNNAGQGRMPDGDMVTDGAGAFFGTNQQGGPAGAYGTLWKFVPASGAFTVLRSFAVPMPFSQQNSSVGLAYDPVTQLLFGAEQFGGATNEGVIYRQTTTP